MEIAEYKKMYELVEIHWWYRSRTRIVSDALKKLYGKKGNLKILDLASGVGNNFENLASWGRVYGVDIATESIKFCKERGIDRIVRCDALKLPFENRAFDAVIALDAFEHFENDVAAMSEANRVIKEGGLLIATAPAMMVLWSQHDEAFHHHRRYNRKEIKSKLEKAGFDVQFVSYWTSFLMPLVFLFRKIKKMSMSSSQSKSDFHNEMPVPLAWTFEIIQRFESLLLSKNVRFPFGVSIFSINKKKAYLK